MIACPKGPEVVRSGTWATVRRVRKQGTVLYLCIRPSGEGERPLRLGSWESIYSEGKKGSPIMRLCDICKEPDPFKRQLAVGRLTFERTDSEAKVPSTSRTTSVRRA